MQMNCQIAAVLLLAHPAVFQLVGLRVSAAPLGGEYSKGQPYSKHIFSAQQTCLGRAGVHTEFRGGLFSLSQKGEGSSL